MNSLDVLIQEALSDAGISRRQLVEECGYSKNPAKGIRRLNHLIETGECTNNDFVEKLVKFLSIPPAAFKTATDSVKEKHLAERERSARENFRPHIEVKFDQVPRPIFAAALGPGLWKIPVPENIRNLNYEEELKEVVRIFRDHCKQYQGRFAGGETSAKYVGFRYHRSYDESILFDNDGKILQVDEKHIPENQAYVQIK